MADAIRNPKRGKAHRSTLHPNAPARSVGQTACGKYARDMTEHIDVERTAPEDRCKACWPEGTESDR
ncbi:hypothetical protein INN71_02565 [Nocardioides sp. ChNu-153]|uniref:hypothetical protein n=1 Tax=unclassified Nocardioides TaxID=2615069 RepID=UPI002406B6D8|nr:MULTISPECIES: hypothetical protein [unclassified Nocardioides]MDF9717629.1 hypothetical protein [Nocardioides sp. ChNu-99]MDN7120268.1 hypothetical protein [Nocardioides sp. ChNu-153]